MTKAIIFDFDGTVSNRQRSVLEFYRWYFKKFFSDLDPEAYEIRLQEAMILDMYGFSNNFSIGMRAFMERYGIGEYFDDFIKNFMDKSPIYTCLKWDADKTLKELKKRGYILGLLTNGGSEFQRKKIRTCDAFKYFDDFVISGDTDTKKPDPRIFEMMAEKLGLKCEDCTYVGDNIEIDMQGAVKAGMRGIWIWPDKEKPGSSYYRHIVDLQDLLDIYD